MSQCEITENQAEQNKSHAVAGIEAHPTPPHCCFFRNDRCNLAHADLQRGVTGRELWPPERVDEVDDSERKDNARTKNHENFCGQDALAILWDIILRPSCAPSATSPNALFGLRQSFYGRLVTSCDLCGQGLKQPCAPCSLPTEPVGRRRCGHGLRQRVSFFLDGCSSRSALRVRD